MEIAFIWDILELLIRYTTSEIIEEKVVLSLRDFLYRIVFLFKNNELLTHTQFLDPVRLPQRDTLEV